MDVTVINSQNSIFNVFLAEIRDVVFKKIP